MTKNKRSDKITKKVVYPSVSPDDCLKHFLKSDHDKTKKICNIYAHILFDIVFNDNNDIFRNSDCNHIDRFQWCNKPDNTRCAISLENQSNKGIYSTKIDRKHNKHDIDYLEN
jgi:hypothetical protein